jgi:dTDP-4-amino-4,6-dideoxygalactose transaminase
MIPLFKVYMAPTAAPAVTKVLDSGYIGQGPKVEEFEENLKAYLDNDMVLTTNSATSAEHLALLLLQKPAHNVKTLSEYSAQQEHNWPGLEPGDEILATALTCTASNWPIILGGYRPKWVDIDENTLNMDLDDLARKITPKTKAIMLVFWGGMPVDMERLSEIQDNTERMYGFRPAVILDGAHSLGSKYNNKQICNFGHITTYSFQAIKHVTSIDGGALIVPHADLYKRAKLLRWYGIDRDSNRKDFRCETDIAEVGTKWHMNDVNAVVGIENLKHANEIIGTHKDNAGYYNKVLTGVPGVSLFTPTPNSDAAYWIYTIKVENRSEFMDAMKARGITVSRVHERNDIHTATKEYVAQLPTLDRTVKQMICIPNGWWITKENREYIVDSIKKGW